MIALDRVLTRLNGKSLNKVIKEGMRSDSMKEQVYYANELNKEYLQMEKTTTTSAEGISKVTRKFNQQGKVVTEVTEEIDKYGNKIKKVTDSNIGFNFKNALFSIGKILIAMRVVTRAARRLGQIAADVVQYGSDYAETLNLWQVAMRGMNSEAQTFVNTMSKAYGISEKTLMENQAIFKNMIGSLGNISNEAAYKLSEAITGMALDFASLYNVTFEQASTKFQAALAGQVRPIRSVSGYDITESTLFEFYQQMGGEKTMRQLNRTEKQLLAIYAVFEQMQSSGATGDMAKTIEQFANQSRMLSENWKQLLTYVGLLMKAIIEQTKLLPRVNALLITASEIVKSIVYMLYPDTAMPNFLENMFEDAENANEATDELLGKLFSFDKFNAAKSSTGGVLGIDDKILKALSEYTSKIKEASNSSREMADKWLKTLGLTKETWYKNDQGIKITLEDFEKLTEEEQKAFTEFETYGLGLKDGKLQGNIKKIIDALKIGGSVILSIVSTIFGYFTITKIATLIANIKKMIAAGSLLTSIFNPTILAIAAAGAALLYLYSTNEDFKASVEDLGKILFDIYKYALQPIKDLWLDVAPSIKAILDVLAPTLTMLFDLTSIILEMLNKIGVIKFIIDIIVAPFYAIKGILDVIVWLVQAIPALIDKVKGFFGSLDIKSIFLPARKALGYADGGIPDRGTLFWAGEAGAEAVANIGGGRAGVMNVRQMEEAVARGVVRATESKRDNNVNGTISINIGGTNFVNITQRELAKQGYKLVRV